jgi:hypothetical protein
MSSDLFSVGATPVARPGSIGNHVGYCIERRATHRVAPTGFVYDPAEAGRAGV